MISKKHLFEYQLKIQQTGKEDPEDVKKTSKFTKYHYDKS